MFYGNLKRLYSSVKPPGYRRFPKTGIKMQFSNMLGEVSLCLVTHAGGEAKQDRPTEPLTEFPPTQRARLAIRSPVSFPPWTHLQYNTSSKSG